MCDDSCIFLVTTQSTGGIDPASLSPAPPRSATHAAMPQIGPTPVPASRRRRSRALRRRSTGRRRARPRPIRVPLRSCWPTTPSPVRDVDEDDDALTAYQIFSLPGLHLLLSPYYVSTKATLYFSPHSKQHLSRASLQKKNSSGRSILISSQWRGLRTRVAKEQQHLSEKSFVAVVVSARVTSTPKITASPWRGELLVPRPSKHCTE